MGICALFWLYLHSKQLCRLYVNLGEVLRVVFLTDSAVFVDLILYRRLGEGSWRMARLALFLLTLGFISLI